MIIFPNTLFNLFVLMVLYNLCWGGGGAVQGNFSSYSTSQPVDYIPEPPTPTDNPPFSISRIIFSSFSNTRKMDRTNGERSSQYFSRILFIIKVVFQTVFFHCREFKVVISSGHRGSNRTSSQANGFTDILGLLTNLFFFKRIPAENFL